MKEDPNRDYASEYNDDNPGEASAKSKRELIAATIHQLWQQHPRTEFVGTYNDCDTPDCAYSVRGTGKCKRCTANKLQDLIGVEDGTKYARSIEIIREIERKYLTEPD